MNKPTPQFRQIASPLDDVSDDVLNELGDKLGVPSLVKPEQPPPPPADKPISQSSTPNTMMGMSRTGKSLRQTAPLPVADQATSPLERVSVDLPDYLYQAMRMRVAEEGTTMRFVVMQGLQAIGFRIDPCDFIPDGRSTRSKTS